MFSRSSPRNRQGLRISQLSKLTPQNGQKAIRRPTLYWLAIWMPSRSLQLGHVVRSRYSSAPNAGLLRRKRLQVAAVTVSSHVRSSPGL